MTPWSRSQGRDGEARCTFASGAGSPVPAYDALPPSCGFSSGTAHTRAPVRTREPRGIFVGTCCAAISVSV